MEAITASLERSLQNCSLNNNNNNNQALREEEEEELNAAGVAGIGISSSSHDVSSNNHISNSNSTTLELNSHISLPYHWEQCLDLKTGEIYYINWRNGLKAKEDPRRGADDDDDDDDESEEEEDESLYDSEEEEEESSSSSSKDKYVEKQKNVLVVAGCKSCLMYFMVPKQVEDCPKCTAQLLHFDRSQNASL